MPIAPTFKPGDHFRHYTVGRLLGTGFHGSVHEIVHDHTGAAFALKTMHLANTGDARKVRRALAEAKGTYGIDHANVVRVHDFNCEDSGLVWMLLELLDGETLAALQARLGRLSAIFALSAAIEAADGLAAAHEAGVIHRDVKPANLMYVTATRSLKVIDFSIAKIFAEGLQTTEGRAGMGTLAFMPPEQMDGAPAAPAMDIYALGTSLWQLLAGRHPLEDALDRSKELSRRQYIEMPPLLADVAGLPPQVDEVVRKAVEKDPARRYRSMRAMRRALAELRSLLEKEAKAERIVLVVMPGEPPPPCEARSRREYTPPQAAPLAEEAPAAPAARVVAPGAAMLVARSAEATVMVRGFGGTMPLAALGGTVPLGAGGRPPPPPSPAPPPEPRRGEVTVVSARPPSRRIPWRTAGLAVALASLATLGAVGVLRRHPPRKHDPEPPQAIVTAPPPPEAAPPPPPSLPPPAAPVPPRPVVHTPVAVPSVVRAPTAAAVATPAPAPAAHRVFDTQ